MHAFLLIEVVDHRRISARERLEALFASGVRQTAAIKNKSAAVPTVVLRQAAMKRKTENANHQIVGIRRQALQFFRCQHAVEGSGQRG